MTLVTASDDLCSLQLKSDIYQTKRFYNIASQCAFKDLYFYIHVNFSFLLKIFKNIWICENSFDRKIERLL